MKVFRGVRVAVKRFAARHWLIIEYCKDCGVKQPVVWTADDELWNLVWGNDGGVLCPRCFDSRCRRLGLFLLWMPTVETIS